MVRVMSQCPTLASQKASRLRPASRLSAQLACRRSWAPYRRFEPSLILESRRNVPTPCRSESQYQLFCRVRHSPHEQQAARIVVADQENERVVRDEILDRFV